MPGVGLLGNRIALAKPLGTLVVYSPERFGTGSRRSPIRTRRRRRDPLPGGERSKRMTIDPEGAGAQYARRADPESSVWSLGCLFTVLADSEETGGQYALIESLSPKGAEPPRHVHSREDETFYVLEGEITFYIGEETYAAAPGAFVSAPRGVPHSYTFETDVIRMLVIVAPGGFEEFFRDPRFSEPAWAAELPPPPKARPTLRGWSPPSSSAA
jgi:quercetin dioxygenase-like cupin family protein